MTVDEGGAEARALPAEQVLNDFYAAYRASSPEALQIGQALLEQDPDHRSVWVKLARLQFDRGRIAQVVEVAQEGLQHFVDEPQLLHLGGVAVARLRGDAAGLPWFERLAATGKDGGFGHYRLGDYLLQGGEAGPASEHFARAAEAGYASPKFTLRRYQAAILARDPALARSLLPSLPPELQSEAEHEIEGLEGRRERLESARSAGRLRSLSSNQLKRWAEGRAIERGRPGRSDLFISEHGDLLGDRRVGSRALVLVFGGLRDMVGASLPKFDRDFRPHRVSTLYLSDPRRLLMLAGAPSFGSYEQTIAGLRELIARWGVERLYCQGMSAGGYPAILYGLELGARRILTMAAPTDLIGEVADADGRARIVMNRIRAAVDDSKLDLRQRLIAAPAPPQIINYYGADSAEDVRHAQRLQGLPNVSLRPVDGEVGHNVFAALKDRGEYPAVLAEFLADA